MDKLSLSNNLISPQLDTSLTLKLLPKTKLDIAKIAFSPVESRSDFVEYKQQIPFLSPNQWKILQQWLWIKTPSWQFDWITFMYLAVHNVQPTEILFHLDALKSPEGEESSQSFSTLTECLNYLSALPQAERFAALTKSVWAGYLVIDTTKITQNPLVWQELLQALSYDTLIPSEYSHCLIISNHQSRRGQSTSFSDVLIRQWNGWFSSDSAYMSSSNNPYQLPLLRKWLLLKPLRSEQAQDEIIYTASNPFLKDSPKDIKDKLAAQESLVLTLYWELIADLVNKNPNKSSVISAGMFHSIKAVECRFDPNAVAWNAKGFVQADTQTTHSVLRLNAAKINANPSLSAVLANEGDIPAWLSDNAAFVPEFSLKLGFNILCEKERELSQGIKNWNTLPVKFKQCLLLAHYNLWNVILLCMQDNPQLKNWEDMFSILQRANSQNNFNFGKQWQKSAINPNRLIGLDKYIGTVTSYMEMYDKVQQWRKSV